ncbi:hypothetical protein IMCC3317_36450 [Kordia antarctica]|uniref:DUF456 domain-containing protein n=1 Tax=Kordia antarctica TaxID=1218801 RepID=A0A7L4ZNR1_9FLAO|nr:DUF456 domain-containing protein [Kordia antarctica]QHI38255.1 hypothetical protein IMCC3317_36450 [Kordia antarctica]
MDIFFTILGFLLMLLGIIGSFLPIIPGPITSWFGLLFMHLTEAIPNNWTFLGITLAIAIIVFVLDYIIPAIGTKRFGGSKYGIYGTTIGLLLGLLFLGPFGIIIGPFLGALVGELAFANKDASSAFKAAFGSLIGFLFSTFLKLIVALIYLGFFISDFWEYKGVIF